MEAEFSGFFSAEIAPVVCDHLQFMAFMTVGFEYTIKSDDCAAVSPRNSDNCPIISCFSELLGFCAFSVIFLHSKRILLLEIYLVPTNRG